MSMKRRITRPSPALIVAVLALVAGLTGAAIAQPAAKKVTTKKVKKISKKVADQEIASVGPTLFAGQDAVRYVRINADASIDPALSKGVAAANVTAGTPAPGNYCISGLDPAPQNAQAAIDFTGSPFNAQIYVHVNPTTGPCSGKQVWVSTFNPANTPTSMPTYVALFSQG